MSNSIKLIFLKRVKEHYLQLFKLYKSTVDWVVWLYFIIPAMIISVYQYIRWWQVPWNLDMSEEVLTIILFGILFLFLQIGNVRFFMERADQLFYRQFEGKYDQLMKLGMYYSSFINFLLTSIVFLVLAPIFIVQLAYSWYIWIAFFFFIMFARLIVIIARQLLQFRWNGWKYYIAISCFSIVKAWVYMGLVYSWLHFNDPILIILSLFLVISLCITVVFFRLRKNGVFQEDIAREIMLKYRFTSMALQGATIMGAQKFQKLKPPKVKKRSWLFRNSETIFSKRTVQNAMIELHIKYIIRSKERRRSFFQLTSVLLFAIIIAPEIIKWIIWGLGIIIFIQINCAYVSEMKRSIFLKTFDWNEKMSIIYTSRSVFWINAPFLILIGFVAGALLLSWWGLLYGPIFTISISYLIQPLFQK
ncbi:ABC transporter permease [Evansella sp. AB-rgal1]|uniref:ABC transporter permease n=1 Tax=Evansella sp. AB-rgal1 TaxID=3242696 RepID=UPI00359DF0AE